MLIRLGSLLLAAALLAGPARADDLADFNAAVEAASAHNRTALGYLRTGNKDLVSLEIDRLREAWQRVGSVKRPAVFDQKLYVREMTDIAMRLVTADMMVTMGKPEGVRASLLAMRDDLYDLRTSAHVAVLADCIKDSNTAMAALLVFDDPHLDFARPGVGADLTAKADAYGATLKRCDGIASATVREEPEYRSLIDGSQ
jgi:hypothetical protein